MKVEQLKVLLEQRNFYIKSSISYVLSIIGLVLGSLYFFTDGSSAIASYPLMYRLCLLVIFILLLLCIFSFFYSLYKSYESFESILNSDDDTDNKDGARSFLWYRCGVWSFIIILGFVALFYVWFLISPPVELYEKLYQIVHS